jgi:hypothetical protein
MCLMGAISAKLIAGRERLAVDRDRAHRAMHRLPGNRRDRPGLMRAPAGSAFSGRAVWPPLVVEHVRQCLDLGEDVAPADASPRTAESHPVRVAGGLIAYAAYAWESPRLAAETTRQIEAVLADWAER